MKKSQIILIIVVAAIGLIIIAVYNQPTNLALRQLFSFHAVQPNSDNLAIGVTNSDQTQPVANSKPTPVLPPAQTTTLKNGAWGGDHIQLTVASSAITVEFDCAHGTVTSPIVLDKNGQFSATGIYSQEHGGPVREGEPSNDQPAIYAGSVSGNAMSLIITLSGSKQIVGTYNLTFGSTGRVFKCL